MNDKIVITKNVKETQEFAKEFATGLKGGDVLLLYGNLGAGKTTFVQGLAKGLGIEKRLISPTFTIVRNYELGIRNNAKDFYHVDLYRHETDEAVKSSEVLELMKKYWPGGLTIVLPCKTDKVLESIRGGGSTIGVRQPNSKILQELIQKVDVPITGTSANFHGKKTPTKQSELEPELIKLVDLVIPGDSGMQQASTILDCSVKPWKILRQGAIVL